MRGEGDWSYRAYRSYDLVCRVKAVEGRGRERERAGEGEMEEYFLTARNAKNSKSGRFW